MAPLAPSQYHWPPLLNQVDEIMAPVSSTRNQCPPSLTQAEASALGLPAK